MPNIGTVKFVFLVSENKLALRRYDITCAHYINLVPIIFMNTDLIKKEALEIISSPQGKDVILQKIAELLDREVPEFNWTGFYLSSATEERMLELGPYVGEATDHAKIPYGTGICGQAAETLDTFVVQDVSEADNYLACSVDVKSEIVVPIMKNGEFVGELDIDSHTKHAITDDHKSLCEWICKELETVF